MVAPNWFKNKINIEKKRFEETILSEIPEMYHDLK